MKSITRISRSISLRDSLRGVEWNRSSSSPVLHRINYDGERIGTQADFDGHPVWGNIKRCILSVAGTPTYGSNARGDGLDLTGASGRIMVDIPKFYVKSEHPSADVYRRWISSVLYPGFELHPAFVQRGGTIRDHVYVGAYEAYGYDDAGTFKLCSRTGVQPVTGAVSYTDLPNSGRFNIGDARTYAGNIGSRWGIMNIWTLSALQMLYIIEYANLNSQSTSVGIGRGIVDLDSGAAFLGAESGMGTTDTDIGTNGTGVGAQEQLNFDAGTAAFVATETVTGAGGASGTVVSITVRAGGWATNDASGYMILSSVSGTFVNNEALTGSVTGAATADGINCTTIVYRGIENLWGNTLQFIDGYNALNAEYRLINRDGSGTFADALAAGDYEASAATPTTTDGYVTDIEHETLLKYLLIAKTLAGSSSTYLCDYLYAHDTDETNILLYGGSWAPAVGAGVACLYSHNVASRSSRDFGGRLEFIKE